MGVNVSEVSAKFYQMFKLYKTNKSKFNGGGFGVPPCFSLGEDVCSDPQALEVGIDAVDRFLDQGYGHYDELMDYFSEWVCALLSDTKLSAKDRYLRGVRVNLQNACKSTGVQLTCGSFVKWVVSNMNVNEFRGIMYLMVRGLYYTGKVYYETVNEDYHKFFSQAVCSMLKVSKNKYDGETVYRMLLSSSKMEPIAVVMQGNGRA